MPSVVSIHDAVKGKNIKGQNAMDQRLPAMLYQPRYLSDSVSYAKNRQKMYNLLYQFFNSIISYLEVDDVGYVAGDVNADPGEVDYMFTLKPPSKVSKRAFNQLAAILQFDPMFKSATAGNVAIHIVPVHGPEMDLLPHLSNHWALFNKKPLAQKAVRALKKYIHLLGLQAEICGYEIESCVLAVFNSEEAMIGERSIFLAALEVMSQNTEISARVRQVVAADLERLRSGETLENVLRSRMKKSQG